MFSRAWRVTRIGGVDIKVDPGLVVIAGLIAWSFHGTFSDRFGPTSALVMAIAGAALFFLSILAHELGHALEARHRGIEVTGITLFLFGGVTEMQAESERPGEEFAIAAVGPFMSLVTGSLFGLLATAVDWWYGPPEVSAVFGLLGWLNVGLAVFNLIPGAPLDGGRVLRAALWKLTGDRHRAQQGAARAGQGVAILLFALAFRSATAPEADLTGAIYFAFIGWFLWNAARGERAVAAFSALIDGHLAGNLPIEATEPVPSDSSAAIVFDRMQLEGPRVAPVVRDGEIVGAFVLDDVAQMHPQDRTFRLTEEVMRHGDDLPVIMATQPLSDVIDALREHSVALLQLANGPVTTLTANDVRLALRNLRRGGGTMPPAPLEVREG